MNFKKQIVETTSFKEFALQIIIIMASIGVPSASIHRHKVRIWNNSNFEISVSVQVKEFDQTEINKATSYRTALGVGGDSHIAERDTSH